MQCVLVLREESKKKNVQGPKYNPNTLRVYRALYQKELTQRVIGEDLTMKSKLAAVKEIALELEIDFEELPEGLKKPSLKSNNNTNFITVFVYIYV